MCKFTILTYHSGELCVLSKMVRLEQKISRTRLVYAPSWGPNNQVQDVLICCPDRTREIKFSSNSDLTLFGSHMATGPLKVLYITLFLK